MHDWMREDLLGKERDLWTALTSADPAPAVQKLCNPDVNMMFPEMEILTLEDEDEFKDALKAPFHRFDNYQLDDVRTLFVGLMAGVVTYKVRATRGATQYEATASTTWSQGADGEWLMICHSETLL